MCVRWYLRYPLSYRHLEEMMLEQGLTVDHTTVYRWVQAYAPELDKRCRPDLRPTNNSWRVQSREKSSQNYPSATRQVPQQHPGAGSSVYQTTAQSRDGFGSFNIARRTLRGYEAMNMFRKGQIQGIDRDILGQVGFVSQIFRVAA